MKFTLVLDTENEAQAYDVFTDRHDDPIGKVYPVWGKWIAHRGDTWVGNYDVKRDAMMALAEAERNS